ncbi:MAG: OmpA family protein [Myxococcota bacterium]
MVNPPDGAGSRLLVRIVTAAVCTVALVACTRTPHPLCRTDRQCRAEAGEQCIDGTCQNCATDRECEALKPRDESWTCVDFRCVETWGGGDDLPMLELDDPCGVHDECWDSYACVAGVCSRCKRDADCAPRTCNEVDGRCDPQPECGVDDDCPMDELCRAARCVPAALRDGPERPDCAPPPVQFATGRATLTPEAEQLLIDAAACMRTHDQDVFIEASVPAGGTEAYTISLAERRGRAVEERMVELGVDAQRIRVVAKGALEADPTQGPDAPSGDIVRFVFPPP